MIVKDRHSTRDKKETWIEKNLEETVLYCPYYIRTMIIFYFLILGGVVSFSRFSYVVLAR